MSNKFIMLMLVTFLSIPLSGLAMTGMDHSGDNSAQAGTAKGSMIILGAEEVDGVKASAHLMDVKEEMAKHGMEMTHHIMVNFVEMTMSTSFEKGQVAIKVKDPAGNVSKAQKLMGMDGHFGVDLNLDQNGKYNFTIATKLPDGKKRTYHFEIEL